MGLTIEDMLVISKDKYQMEFCAGKNGWSNSISWILLIEDSIILKDFKGRDLAVTTGLGFNSEDKIMQLVENLVALHAAGLVINLGPYINHIPPSVMSYCDENDFPLLTIPWRIHIFEMIKDLSIHVFFQSETDEQISNAFIHAIEEPENKGLYEKDLLAHFDIDGAFQIILISTGDLDSMDTVERRRISYQIQIYLENITHNGHFFYYDSYFALMLNNITASDQKNIIEGFIQRAKRKMPEKKISVGIGSMVSGIKNVQITYRRAKAAVDMALRNQTDLLYFDEMGLYRMIGLIQDPMLLQEMGADILSPLIDYDQKHNAQYVDTLYYYLAYNGSVQMVADKMFTHRNTVIYRIGNIKKMLDMDLDNADDRMKYMVACMILKF